MANVLDEMESKFFSSFTDYIQGLIAPVLKENESMKSELEKNRKSLMEVSTNYLKLQTKVDTLKALNFAGTKFRGFRGFRGLPRNLIPAKFFILADREI